MRKTNENTVNNGQKEDNSRQTFDFAFYRSAINEKRIFEQDFLNIFQMKKERNF